MPYAIRSVLWQTLQDFELLVIGDGCTDDTAEVVASFNDPRIRWFNLPYNTGNQSLPNNKGLELAHGRYIAYIGHDDLWFPDHLEAMVRTIESTQADLVYTVMAVVQPAPSEKVHLTGLGQTNKYDFPACNRPESSMHRLDLVNEIGPWQHYRSIQLPADVDFFMRAALHRKRFASTHALTAIKFSATSRPNSYVEKSAHEQVSYTNRILQDPNLRYELLMRGVSQRSVEITQLTGRMLMDDDLLRSGVVIEASRQRRGLQPNTDPVKIVESPPIYADKSMLYLINNLIDIAPQEARQALFFEDRLLEDGLLVGLNWVGTIYDQWGNYCRDAKQNAQVIVTRPTGRRRSLFLDAAPKNSPLILTIQDEQENVMAQMRVTRREIMKVDLPIKAGEGTRFSLNAVPDVSGVPGQAVNQPPSLRVYHFGWADNVATAQPGQMAQIRQQDLDELLLFRKTSIRYYVRRFRQWLRSKRKILG